MLNIRASVTCVEKSGEHSYERTGFDTQFVFTHLQPDTEYQFAGFAKLNDVKIVISESIVHTLDAIPQKVDSVTISEETTTSFLISWSKPEKIKGQIDSYKISFTSGCENAKQTICESSLESAYTCSYSDVIIVDTNTTSYRHSAVPGTKYFATVSARTRNPESGPTSDTVVAVTLSEKPHKPRVLRAEKTITGSVLLEYDYPCPHTGPTLFDVH